MLRQREAAGQPVTVGLVGAGKFGTMFLAQARRTPGMKVVAVADLDVKRAARALSSAGWQADAVSQGAIGDAYKSNRTCVIADAAALTAFSEIEVLIEATGIPSAGIRHASEAIVAGKHIVMVTVEADALAGPLLAQKAQRAGGVYSLAWADQPA